MCFIILRSVRYGGVTFTVDILATSEKQLFFFLTNPDRFLNNC